MYREISYTAISADIYIYERLTNFCLVVWNLMFEVWNEWIVIHSQKRHFRNKCVWYIGKSRRGQGLGETKCNNGEGKFDFLEIDLKAYKNISEWKYDKYSLICKIFSL